MGFGGFVLYLGQDVSRHSHETRADEPAPCAFRRAVVERLLP